MKRQSFVIVILLVCGVFTSTLSQDRGNQRAVDSTLRGSGRVNASTLGMEFTLPLGNYPGRGINVPISISYSSKLWRMNYLGNWPVPGSQYSPCRKHYQPKFSENAAAGWTTSLSAPYVKYVGAATFYDYQGNPVTNDDVDCPTSPGGGDPYRPIRYIRRLLIRLPSGESHEMRPDDTAISFASSGNSDPNGPYQPYMWDATYYATDGSNIRYVQNSASGTYRILMPDGSFYDLDATTPNLADRKAIKFTDRNGNFTTFNNSSGVWTDTLGRSIPSPIGQSAPAAGIYTYALPGMTGAYKFNWKPLKGSSPSQSALTDFSQNLKYYGDTYLCNNQSGAWTYCTYPAGSSLFVGGENTRIMAAGSFNPIVLNEIELPTGQKYVFSYDVYGRIEKIIYPTGGEETFEYGVVATLTLLDPSDEVGGQTNFGVVRRKVYKYAGDPSPYEWTYNAGYVSWQAGYVITINNPDGTRTERYLHRGYDGLTDLARFGYDNILAGMPYEERSYNSRSQLVSRKLTTWAFTSIGELIFQWHPRVSSEESIIYDGSGNGVSTVTTTSYETEANLNLRETPVLPGKTTQYAFIPILAGQSPGLSPVPCDPGDPSCEPNPNPPPAPTPVPTPSAPPVRIVESTYLINDPAYAGVKSYYTAQNMVGLVTASQVTDGAGTVVSRSETGYDETGRSPGYRGNPTTARVWDSTKGAYTSSSAYISTSARFDQWGNQIEATDAKGSTTTTAFDSAYNAFPISVTTPIPDPTGQKGSNSAFTTSMTYDFTTGLPISTTDANGQTTTMEYNDPLLRPTRVIAPNGQQTITEYGAGTSASTRFVKGRSQIDADKWKEGYTWFDGLGRTIKTQSVDSAGDVFVETEYDNMGRVKRVSNPYRAGEAIYWTENFYDDLGRVIKVKTPDNAEVNTAYSLATVGNQIGTVVTVTDQAGKARRSITNALGQLTRVDEPDAGGSLGAVDAPVQPTYYSYDTLNNLTSVNQGIQTRSFSYSSLSRLLSAANPESGTINYLYDANGNLTRKTDARGVKTDYVYDALNRVTNRNYSLTGSTPPNYQATPNVTYFYDNLPNAKGKLTKVLSSVSTTEYTAFDILGRVTAQKQTTDGTAYTTGYAYNLSGALIEETYPSGRVVKNVLDNNGDLAIVQSRKSSTSGFFNYAKNFTYTSAGAVTSMQLGNGKWESTTFNSRLQPTQIALGVTQGTGNLLKLDYTYGTTANNGNVLSQTITVPTVGTNQGFTAVQSYNYDALNRLKNATENVTPNGGTSSQSWKQTFAFDRYGNRRFDAANTTTIPQGCQEAVCNPQINTANNRLIGYGFDSSGNTTTDASGQTFIYDAENKQTEVKNSSNATIGQYFYDADGRRIKKYVASTGEVTIFVYDAAAKLVAEYSTIVASQNDAKVSYLTNDHLGSPRITTNALGEVISRRDFMPYGEEIFSPQRTPALAYTADTVRQTFTGYINDDETGLDFAQARYFNSGFGRFSSPDRYGGSGFVSVPQSWNRYVYCLNRPTVFIDPSGLIWLTTDNKSFTWVDDKEYEKNKEKYKDYQVANGAVILLNDSPRKQDKKLIGKYVSLEADGGLLPAAEPATVEVRAEYDDNEISNPWAGLGTLRTPVNGTPGGYDKFRGNRPGKYTLRFYNAKGQAKIDIDFGHNHGAGDPHAHWWDWNDEANGPRGPGVDIPVGSEESVDEDGDRIIKPPADLINPFVVLPVPGRVPVPVRPTVPIRIPIRIPVLIPVIP